MDDILLEMLKTLADATRLRIIGLLAKSPRTVEALAAALGLGASTISHHLAKLQNAGLVTASAQQYYSVYALVPGALDSIGKRIIDTAADSDALSTSTDEDAYARAVIADAVRPSGIVMMPRGLQKQRVLLRWLTENRFEKDMRYSEMQVDDILIDAVFDVYYDTNKLRRDLISEKLLMRTANGALYWRADSSAAQHVDFDASTLAVGQIVLGPCAVARHLAYRLTRARLKGDAQTLSPAELDAALADLGVRDAAAMRKTLWRRDFADQDPHTGDWRVSLMPYNARQGARDAAMRAHRAGRVAALPTAPFEREQVVRWFVDRLTWWTTHTPASIARTWGRATDDPVAIFEAAEALELVARDGEGWRRLM
jgi:DNA-binding transcriptional ArsR family regulator